MPAEPYYSTGKHGYMKYVTDGFPLFTFKQLRDLIPEQIDSVIEFGAGMGRFSGPLVEHYNRVDLVEPAPTYADELKLRFSHKSGVEIFQLDSTGYISRHGSRASHRTAVFCFHLLHHLSPVQRDEIYSFLRNSGAWGFFIEPNPVNPLILIQVLTQRDMKFSEERQYLTLRKSRYARELSRQGLTLEHYRRICLIPPFLADRLLEKQRHPLVAGAERMRSWFPIFCSYQVIVCRFAPQ